MYPKAISITIILIQLLWASSFSVAQNSRKVLVTMNNCELTGGIDNYLSIVAQQNKAVSIEQVEVLFLPYYPSENSSPIRIPVVEQFGKFMIHPDSVGVVKIIVKLDDGVESTKIPVKPLRAVGYLSKYRANSDKKICPSEMKAQLGLSAVVECCGFDARCSITDFEVIRIPANEISEKAINKGGRFEERVKSLVDMAKSGDIYIFRKIRYLCPGAVTPQRLDDMIFEIE